jgi:hypothetical protein
MTGLKAPNGRGECPFDFMKISTHVEDGCVGGRGHLEVEHQLMEIPLLVGEENLDHLHQATDLN